MILEDSETFHIVSATASSDRLIAVHLPAMTIRYHYEMTMIAMTCRFRPGNSVQYDEAEVPTA